MTLRQKYRSIYWCWKAMKQRTRNPRCAAFPNYGGRGIDMTHEWDEFEPFLEWALAAGWKKGLDLDRIDNDGPYCPENCRWTTRRENTNNRRKTMRLTVDGKTLPATEWADLAGIPKVTVKQWVYKHGADYAADRVLRALHDGYTPRVYAHDMKPVVHLESGKVFESVISAAKAFGIAGGYLSTRICHNNGKTRAGTFAFIAAA